MFLGSCLNKVLNKCLNTKDDILKALYILKITDKRAHLTLALGKFYLTILVPEFIATHHSVYILYLFLRAFKQLFGQLIECVIIDTGVTYHSQFTYEVRQFYLSKHIIDSKHPVAIGQLREFLDYLHILYPVNVALLGYGHLATLYLPT